MLHLTFGNYNIKRLDKHNIVLTATRAKQSTTLHPEADGSKTEIIGYYSTLESAMKSLANRSVLDEGDLRDVQSVLEVLSTLKSLIKTTCSKQQEANHEKR